MLHSIFFSANLIDFIVQKSSLFHFFDTCSASYPHGQSFSDNLLENANA